MIVFEKKAPAAAAFQQFMDAPAVADGGQNGFLWKDGTAVIAAYDGDRLIGVGAGTGGEWAAMIHPDYRNRDIEHNMKKLVC